MPAWLKTVGIVDGVMCAALSALGQLVPTWSAYTTIAVEVLGVVGTALGGIAAASGSSTPPATPPAS